MCGRVSATAQDNLISSLLLIAALVTALSRSTTATAAIFAAQTTLNDVLEHALRLPIHIHNSNDIKSQETLAFRTRKCQLNQLTIQRMQ